MSCLREPNAEPLPGYRLIEPLGSGGFGEVWKCEAPGGLFKAIKFVFGNLNSLDVDGARAEQELRALNRIKELRHPFVLAMDRIEILEGELLIVMELADKNLHDAYQEAQSSGLIGVPRESLLRYMRDVAEALDYMCEHGLQHLDIKPRNLFLVSDRVKVADFGLVRTLERGSGSGALGGVTPLYAAPETFNGKVTDRSDQYSLAIVYQELLTSQRPFNGKNPRQLAQQHLGEEPELRSLPEAERPVIARALAKDPSKRFPNCLAFVRALYTVRPLAKRGRASAMDIHLEPTARGRPSQRPKTMAETMEDILLEQGTPDDDDDRLEQVDLGAEPAWAPSDNSNLGITAALPQTGSLRPTVVIGLGSLGRRTLLELRCRFLDRFGELGKLPAVRFLALDSDRESLLQGQRGTPEIQLQPHEVQHLPLQPMAHYRRRQMDQLAEWLPREKLYAMPRSLQTQGCRALGRLAFTDNYLRLLAKLKREIQAATHPDALYRSVANTGLALRDNSPRVLIVSSASGGASGYLVDLAYALRRLLRQMRHPEGRLNAFLLCGAPDDPATPPVEQANLYATLTELNHYSENVTAFNAQYGVDDQRQVEPGAPFDAVYLLAQKERTPDARRDVIAHLGSYLFHDLITPLGPKLEQQRLATAAQRAWSGPGTTFRGFGTHSVWFPRGLLLRLAARRALGQLLLHWSQDDGDRGLWNVDRDAMGHRAAVAGPRSTAAEVEAACARVLADPHLQAGAVGLRIEEAAAKYLDGLPPPQALAQMLQNIEEQCWQYGGPDNPTAWATQALTRVREWLGSGVQGPAGAMTLSVGLTQRKSKLNRALENACSQLAEEWDRKLGESANGLMHLPGPRLALAEAVLNRLVQHHLLAAQEQTTRLKELGVRTAEVQSQVQDALQNCASGGGFRWFAWRPQRPLKVFLDLLAALARQCIAEDTACAVQQFHHALVARLRDRLRDVALLRQRLRQIHERLTVPAELADDDPVEDTPEACSGTANDLSPTPMATLTSFWEVSRTSATTRVVLPDGQADLEQAAAKFVSTLTADHWVFLDQTLQDDVLASRGGLHQFFFSGNDVDRQLLLPLVERATSCLAQYLPVTDVAQVEMADAAGGPDLLATQVKQSLEAACPLTVVQARIAARRDSKVLASVGAGGRGETRHIDEGEKSDETTFLLVPASAAGKAFGDEARRMLPLLNLVRVPGQADLMFCREQNGLTQEELERILGPCRDAYNDAASVPALSPHSRFDNRDWMPLDP